MEWLKKNKKIMIVIAIVIIVALCIGLWSCSASEKNEKKVAKLEEVEITEEEKGKVTKKEKLNNEDEDVKEVEVKEEVKEDAKDEKETTKSEKTETPKKEETKKETSTSKKEDTKKEDTKKEEHSHDWVEVYKEVDNGHYENVCVKEAWTEEVTKTKKVAAEICKGCGHVMFTQEDIVAHTKPAMLAGRYECGTYKTGYVDVEVTETVEHPAEYEKIWVPKIEKVLVGYECSCGETK